MAAQRLDAAEREHEAAGGIAPVGAQRHRARDVEGGDDLAAAPIRMRSRTPMPTSALWTKIRPSRIGMPRWSMNSSGAAPVPPSLPSTTMKSG